MNRRFRLDAVYAAWCTISLAALHYAGGTEVLPRPSGPVADYAGVLDDNTELQINTLARTLWIEAKFGLIVATVPSVGGIPFEEYAASLYHEWGAGVKKGPEDAVVLLSVHPPGIHIEVGHGAEGYLDAQVTGRILEKEGLPYFRKGEYGIGLINTTHALTEVIAERKRVRLRDDPSRMTKVRHTVTTGHFLKVMAIVVIASIVVIIALVVILRLIPAGRRYRRQQSPYDRFGSGAFGGWLPDKK